MTLLEPDMTIFSHLAYVKNMPQVDIWEEHIVVELIYLWNREESASNFHPIRRESKWNRISGIHSYEYIDKNCYSKWNDVTSMHMW